KLEEDAPYRLLIQDLRSACGSLYTASEIAKTEVDILATLKFEIMVASATGFTDYYKQAVPAHPMMLQLLDFLCDLSLISHKFLDYGTSQIAASNTLGSKYPLDQTLPILKKLLQ
ncbi:hypothetical protein BGZ65_008760, partial [Modicella reniformis]